MLLALESLTGEGERDRDGVTVLDDIETEV